ncbi:uncharacterized protein K452DRAFT_295606 [Aplosporella prunicola CBS 121167]|uniref:Mitochondrial zinc maintenance protein 1, mitochondrial n=1 Tax=Aplosporella prunicola CBS 121167 TaxID=1176127 RepID=A0A6A6BLQ2_9PEZI|nr:uncharacterized protein K452DRAFT_295606 [Aplosporella prunicola CBS 121167]KAF2145049.1 hypothetical protein K452DRAFT_295606 [Aplosporella prunicola CBS 121167]
MALQAYRGLLRSARIAFQGDLQVLNAARFEIRDKFDANRALATGSKEQQASIEHANAVATILRENVVQGQAQDENNYKLKIHEHTERGDNESIKFAGKNTLAGVKCCSA